MESTKQDNLQDNTVIQKPVIAAGRYIFATGRRKTAVANVRLFAAGKGSSVINKKPIAEYFTTKSLLNASTAPLTTAGMLKDYIVNVSVKGGGIQAQATAVAHGIAQALASMNDEIRLIMKKNGFLTRDDRKKERKKPGLKGARRSPQWAKR